MKTKLAVLLLSSSTAFSACSVFAGSFTDSVGTHYEQSWTATVRTPSDVSDTINTAKTYAQNLADFTTDHGNLWSYRDVVLQVFGGREAASVAAFLSAIQADAGAGYRAHMAAKAALVKGMGNVHWQIGNEINNGSKLSPSIHAWLGDGLVGGSNDLAIIPAYVEMWLAPAVQGLLEGDPDSRIMLGSIVGSAPSRAFTEALLDYQIKGTHAPALAGKYVREVVGFGSAQYSLFSGDWKGTIDLYTSRGLKVWATEEVGGGGAEKGMCMPGLLRSLSRVLNYNPFGKTFVWGAWAGVQTCDSLMPTVANFMGIDEMIPVANYSSATGTDVEIYSYALGSSGKTATFINAPSGGTLTGAVGTGTVYVFRSTGMTQFPIAASMNIAIGANDAVFIGAQ